MAIVYLSNNSIQIVEGTAAKSGLQVKRVFRMMDSEGVLINGMVTDPDAFKKLFSDFYKENQITDKTVSLVINSTQFVSRLLKVPRLADKKMFEYIPREFSDVERMKEPVYTFLPIEAAKKPEKGQEELQPVLAAMVEKSFLEDYRKLFGDIGIEVVSIECALFGLVRLFGKLPDLQGKTAMIMVVDGMNVENILLVDGVYTYSSRNRVFNDHGTPGFGVEIARAVSNLLQFAQSEKIESPITDVYLSGIDEGDLWYCSESIYQVNHTLNVSELKGGIFAAEGRKKGASEAGDKQEEWFRTYLFPIAGLLTGDPNRSLMRQMKKNRDADEQKKEALRYALPVIIAAGAALLLILGLAGYRMILKERLNRLTEFNERADVVADCAEYDGLQQEIGELEKRVNSAETAWTYIDSYPVADRGVIDQLTECAEGLAEVDVSSYEASTGLLRFSATAPRVDLINHFIELLKQEMIFEDVNYTGYAYQDSTNLWTIQVTCYLSEYAGKETGGSYDD